MSDRNYLDEVSWNLAEAMDRLLSGGAVDMERLNALANIATVAIHAERTKIEAQKVRALLGPPTREVIEQAKPSSSLAKKLNGHDHFPHPEEQHP